MSHDFKRDTRGRFARGNRGGPGRPKTPARKLPPRDPFEMMLERTFDARVLREADDAWKILLARGITPELLDVAREARQRGMPLPEVLARAIEPPESLLTSADDLARPQTPPNSTNA